MKSIPQLSEQEVAVDPAWELGSHIHADGLKEVRDPNRRALHPSTLQQNQRPKYQPFVGQGSYFNLRLLVVTLNPRVPLRHQSDPSSAHPFIARPDTS